MMNIIGDSQRKSRYDPNLAEQFNREVELEEKREALKNKKKPKVQEEKVIIPSQTAEPKNDYVYVPTLRLYLSENRYLQDKDWNQTQEILHKEGRRMPTIPEFIEFSKYLKSKEGKANVKNAEAILDEIYTIRAPGRAEWLDAKFKGNKVTYHIFDAKGKIVKKSDELENYLTVDQTPGIDLESWLDNPTKQGLPTSKTKAGKLYYYYPREDCVAWFDADSVGAGLFCNWNPDFHYAGLGVRYVEPIAMGEDRAKK